MVRVYDMASGEAVSCAEADSALQTRQWTQDLDVMPRLQPVTAEPTHETARTMPADIATLPVAQFLAKQI